ncbi:hypothetical protein [Marinomonas pollencensis]|uniref:hypothetical protein n=1 Tax=Marinomonas pollencensis TaxID=491954 RepID=UPI000E245B54|nr:hypothetical protein [Marinomonas pollencensis]
MDSLQTVLHKKALLSQQMSPIWLTVLLCLSFIVSTLCVVTFLTYPTPASFFTSPIFMFVLFMSASITCLLVRYWCKNAHINLARQILASFNNRDDSLKEQLVRVAARPTTG